jgi:hypothetical protein
MAMGHDTDAYTGYLRILNNTLIAGGTVGTANAFTVTGVCENNVQDVLIQNNLVTGFGASDGRRNISLDHSMSSLDIDYNVWDSDGDYHYNGTTDDNLTDWKSTVSDEANSAEYTPTFQSAADFHLDTSDTCAQEQGVSMATYIDDDIDGDLRPQGSLWDIGADEYESGYSPPDGACCTVESCAVTTEAACTGGSIWQGADTACSPNPCIGDTEPLGGEFAGVTLEGITKE